MNYILNSKNFHWTGNIGIVNINQFSPWIKLRGSNIGVRSARTNYVMEFVFTQELTSIMVNDVIVETFFIYTSKDGHYKIILVENVIIDV